MDTIDLGESSKQKKSSASDLADEEAPLLDEPSYATQHSVVPRASIEECNIFFTLALDEQLDMIVKFYARKEVELLNSISEIADEIKTHERNEEQLLRSIEDITNRTRTRPTTPQALLNGKQPAEFGQPEDSITMDYDLSSHSATPAYFATLIWSSANMKGIQSSLAKQLTSLYVALCELREFTEINETGFSKILKKYDKVVGAKLKPAYLARVEQAFPFLPATKANVTHAIDHITSLYARIATEGKITVASSDLKNHLREHIVWERNTIWRDMVEQERRQQTIGFVPKAPGPANPQVVTIKVFGCPIQVPSVIPSNIFVIVLAFVALGALMEMKVFATPEQNNCFALLIFASILWAFEALPLFVTAMLVPLFVVLLQVMRDPVTGKRLDAKDSANAIFAEMFGPVIMLLLGGFSLAGALSKYNIAKAAASYILSKAGTRPHQVLLANMFVSTFASMLISNVAAPVLCFSLIQPILRNLPHRSRYARCLVLGVAMSANVGGMASPISSPQNVIAIGNMNPAPIWLQWLAIALPTCILIDVLIWLLLLAIYRPQEETVPPELFSNKHIADKGLTGTQLYIIAVTALTVLLWCIEPQIEGSFGNMGIIGIIPIVCFYGAGVLTKDDWNSMLWSGILCNAVVMLAMGGIALGKAIKSSGLLASIAASLVPHLHGLSFYYTLAIITAAIVVVTSFVSHTVGALIVLPVVAKIGESLPDPRPRTLVMAAALMCSGGMALPVSSFPNMNAISLEDPRGDPWLTVKDFLMVGVISSVIAWAATMSLSYIAMVLIDFQ